MKMLKNLTAAKLNFASRTMAPPIGAQRRRKRPRQSVPRGWIGSYSRSIPAIVPVSVDYPPPSGCQSGDSGPAADPLLAALVDLFLPERHPFFERVDRVLARGERVLAVRRRDGDHDGRFADLDPAGAVMDGDVAQVVALLESAGDLGHYLFRHLLV